MKERIRAIMESKEMTQQEFSQFLEMSPASLSSIFTGRTNPTLNVVESIKKKFENINLDWLMFGNGPMFIEEHSEEKSESDSIEEFPEYSVNDPQNVSYAQPETYNKNNKVIEAGKNGYIKDNSKKTFYGSSNPSFSDMKIFNNSARKIKEIRVFYDDQTYESFVPKE